MFRIRITGIVATLFLGLIANADAQSPSEPSLTKETTQTRCKRYNGQNGDLLITPPSFIKGTILCEYYDGESDDLLTAGLGKKGLENTVFTESEKPTAAPLRRRAIYTNYRALVDMSEKGGYGKLYGPNIDVRGKDTLGEGKIAGGEYLAFADDGSGQKNVTMMVQIPDTFDPKNACIVAAPSSGSRGVYGAIATAGEWGLKHGCAVAYTDKGTGMGTHDLQRDTVNLINGLRKDARDAGKESNFTARIAREKLEAFNNLTSNRFAFKHAHSQQNPEQDWGKNVLQSIEFAFFLLNDRFDQKINKENTLVIASSVSNGGGASLRAAELDDAGLIDGVVVGEPQIQLPPLPFLTIKRSGAPVASFGKGLFEYITIANLLQPCAALAPSNAQSPLRDKFDVKRAEARCAALADSKHKIISGSKLEDQANDALGQLHAAGWEKESDLLHASYYAVPVTPTISLPVTPAIAVTYANAYNRASVVDNLCAFSFGATDSGTGDPILAGLPPQVAEQVAQIFANGSGIPPTPPISGINIINNHSPGGAKEDTQSKSCSTNKEDFNFDGALCLRNLALTSDKVAESVRSIQATGNLHGKPAIIVHGRSDALIPVNHTSRPYYGLNQSVEGGRSQLVYIEVTNAQHFDAFLRFSGYDTRFIPLHYYFVQAMDLIYNHLRNNAALPPSQIVQTQSRGGDPGNAPALTLKNVLSIAEKPAERDKITFGHGTLFVPD